MGHSNCGRKAAALAMTLFGLPPALAMDRDAGALAGGVGATIRATRPRPTRFDYLVLASFADAPGLLSLSTYHVDARSTSTSGLSPDPCDWTSDQPPPVKAADSR